MALARWVGVAVVLAAVGGTLWVSRAADRAARLAEETWPPVGAFVETAQGQVHYLQRGDGPDVVLLHGASGNLRDYSFDLMDKLVQRGFRVTAFDRPGLGYTDRAAPGLNKAFTGRAESPAEQARMLAEAAETLGIRRPVVVGHSFGGSVAMAWALDHDAAAVVSLAGAVMPWPGELGLYHRVFGSVLGSALLAPLAVALVDPMKTGSTVAGIFAPQAMPDGYLDHVGPGLTLRTPVMRANVRQINTLKPHVTAMARRYPSLEIPVEFLHGSEDTTVPLVTHSEPASRLLPNAALTVLEGVGHMPQHARPGAALEAIERAARRAGLR